MNDWIVVLEYRATRRDQPFDLSMVEVLVERLRDWHPVGMYHPDRYALQLQVDAASPDEALHVAAHRHGQAVRAMGSPAVFIRAEVLTVSEFEQTWHQQSVDSSSTARHDDDPPMVSTEVYDATRALVSASSPATVTEILADFVLAIGATVYVGSHREHADMVTIDLSILPGHELRAVAERISVAGLILERWLPPLLYDARRKLDLLDAH